MKHSLGFRILSLIAPGTLLGPYLGFLVSHKNNEVQHTGFGLSFFPTVKGGGHTWFTELTNPAPKAPVLYVTLFGPRNPESLKPYPLKPLTPNPLSTLNPPTSMQHTDSCSPWGCRGQGIPYLQRCLGADAGDASYLRPMTSWEYGKLSKALWISFVEARHVLLGISGLLETSESGCSDLYAKASLFY